MTEEQTRSEEVYRRWQSLPAISARVEASPVEWFEILNSLILLFATEIFLIFGELLPDFSKFGLLSPYYILPSLLFAPAQGWYVHTLLSCRSPSDASTPRWLKVVRCLLGSISFLSPIVVTGWTKLIKRRPEWLFSPPNARVDLSLMKQPPSAFLRKGPSGFTTIIFLLATLFNSMFFCMGILWLAFTDTLGRYRLAVLVPLSLVLHICFLLGWNLRSTTSKDFTTSSLLYLLPLFPMVVLFRRETSMIALTSSIKSGAGPLLRAKQALRGKWAKEPWFRQCYELIWLMIAGGTLLFTLWFLSCFSSDVDRSASFTGVLFFAFCQLASLDEQIGLLSLKILYSLALLIPLWSLILFVQFRVWLLRPFSLRDIFDLRLPPAQRLVLFFKAVTAALPFGGLAIPFWIYSRRYLWARFEANRLRALDPQCHI